MDEYKTCTKCGQTKLLDNFSRHNGKKSNRSGYRASCKSCELAYQRTYAARNRAKAQMNNKSWKMKNPDARAMIQARSYQKNKSKRQSYMAKYRRDNPEKIRTYISKRRAQMSDSSTWMVTEKDLSKMLNKPCSYCQIRSAVHIDHIIPLSKGGNHSVGNLTGACRGCNLSKGSMFVMEWRRRRERMDINLLAKEMRDRALLIEGDESLDETSLRSFAVVNQERQKKRQRLEDMKKLYFNAGRWVGGARDQSARESFIRMREYEARESR